MTDRYLTYAYTEQAVPKLNDELASYEARLETNEDGIADRPIGEVLIEVFDHLCDTAFPGFVQDGWMTKSYNWFKQHEDEFVSFAASLYKTEAGEEVKTEAEEE